MQRWRVPLGFLCAAIFFLLSRPRPLTLIIGGAIALPGLALRAWATGHLRKNDALAVTGPYAYTRNPLFLGIYVPVMRVESATLAQLFGKSYQGYLEAVPLFLPRLSPYRDGTITIARFDGTLYRRYREYQAAM